MGIPLAKPEIDAETRDEVDRVLREEYFLRGDSVRLFESEFAEYVGTEHAVAVSSGTQALHLSLKSLGISDGDTVITTPATFIATANAIVRTGSDIEFVDITLDDYTLDMDSFEQTIETIDDIGAIVPVHLYGYPVDVSRIREIAGDVPIVSDACQAHGATYQDEKIGSRSTLAGFSFYPSKNMTVAGDGGMIVTDDEQLAERARSYRDVGRSSDGEHVRVGYTARLDTVKAAVGRKQLAKLDRWNERRREIARRYRDGLKDIDALTLPQMGDEIRSPAWYLYVVRTQRREELANFLAEQNIETGVQYSVPVHLQPPYREMGYEEGMFPASERWADEVLSLPVHPHLEDDEIEYILTAMQSFFEGK